MSNRPILLPAPRQMSLGNGTMALREQGLIVLDSPDAGALLFSARRLQEALVHQTGIRWEIVAGNAVPHNQIAATLSVVEGGTRHPQGYELTITSARSSSCWGSGGRRQETGGRRQEWGVRRQETGGRGQGP